MSEDPIIDLGKLPMTEEEYLSSIRKLQSVGFIGKSRIVNGQEQIHIGPEHLAIAKHILSHPEKWPDNWSDERRAQWYALRDLAITKGFIQP